MIFLCPSRGRPANVRRLSKEWKKRSHIASLRFIFDQDDPELEHNQSAADITHGIGLEYVIVPRQKIGALLNQQAIEGQLTKIHTCIGFLGDDHLPRTQDFDMGLYKPILHEECEITYPNDCLQGPRMCSSAVLSCRLIDMLGYMVNPALEHLFIDNWWLSLGRCAEVIQYVPSVTIEHLHPSGGTAGNDSHYLRVNSSGQYQKDKQAFDQLISDGTLEAEVARVKEMRIGEADISLT